ncbi:MAG: helix-turn-helix transcriptional regulator [Lentisphaeria bacterium]|nr:helix-turn-helix transcriptional regulator [Lentisphaeria bacterium]
MENQTFDLRNVRRYLDFPLKIGTIGFRPKNNWVHRQNRITQYYLCFVLKSEKPVSITRVNGSLQKFDRSLPRMGLVCPGTVLDSVEPSCKDELFFTYSAESGEQIENFQLRNCCFELTPAFNDTLQRIRNSFSQLQYPGVADRLDCLAIELAQEAMIASLSQGKKPASQLIPDERIFLISNYFQIHYSEPVTLAPLLKKHGMTRRTFYREWKKYYTISPAQFLIDLRLKAACEQLAHSQKKIYEIAADCGFCDPMYFNHCFLAHFGCSPLAYRKKHLSAGQMFQGN